MPITPKNEAQARLAEELVGMQANREVIPPDPRSCVRWHVHDYPSPLARWNYHPEYEIHLIRKGTGKFIVGNYIGTFEAGHVALIGSGLPHDWVSDLAPGEIVEGRDVVIQFDPSLIEGAAAIMPEISEIKTLLDDAARGIQFSGVTSSAATAEIEAIGTSTGAQRLMHLFRLFAILVNSPPEDRRSLADSWFRPQLDDHSARAVEQVLEYIFNNHAGEISMSEAAAVAGMTPPMFSKHFKRAIGQNFSDLVRKLRLAHAKRLLERTDSSISEICFDVGFSNLSNFNRHFMNDFNETPRQFRQRCRSSS